MAIFYAKLSNLKQAKIKPMSQNKLAGNYMFKVNNRNTRTRCLYC